MENIGSIATSEKKQVGNNTNKQLLQTRRIEHKCVNSCFDEALPFTNLYKPLLHRTSTQHEQLALNCTQTSALHTVASCGA